MDDTQVPGLSGNPRLRANGGLTDSSNYALVQFPNGNVEKYGVGWFRGDPTIEEGYSIVVTKAPPPLGVDTGTTIEDTFAILTSALTVIYPATHFSK